MTPNCFYRKHHWAADLGCCFNWMTRDEKAENLKAENLKSENINLITRAFNTNRLIVILSCSFTKL
jgi:hypothetical protein